MGDRMIESRGPESPGAAKPRADLAKPGGNTPNQLHPCLRRFLQPLCDDSGQTLTEYALILLVVAIAAFVFVAAFGGSLQDAYANIVAQWPF